MNRSFFLILISVFLFIGINTIFYFSIYNKQLDFQTEILARQTRLCGSAIEQEGQEFENELNSIPFQDDFTRLFSDEDIKERGAINLRKLYAGYNQLINKITVFDNHNNVFSLILDQKNNFVSDYYESQQQVPLIDRDQLRVSQEKYLTSIPGFDENGTVQTNIVVDINYIRFVNDIFKRFGLVHTLWQFLITEEGKLIFSAESGISISEGDLKHIGSTIQEEEEGFLVHSITVNGEITRVISAYYPVRLVKQNFGIIFSIRTDVFLHSIIIKFIIITLCSLVLLALLLYIHFRVVDVKSERLQTQKISEESLLTYMDSLPIGLLLVNPDGDIRLMNLFARQLLYPDGEIKKLRYKELGFDKTSMLFDDSIYRRTFGPGSMVLLPHHSGTKNVYKVEKGSQPGEIETTMVILVDVSDIENSRKLDKTAHQARKELLDEMAHEISVPLQKLQKTIAESNSTSAGSLQNTFSMLSGLINATMDFASREAIKAVTEEIPFCLRSEIELALEPFKGNHLNTSIITKVRNDVPDKLLGDPFRLRQAIINLIENSIELTEEGRILISAEILEYIPGHLRLKFQVEDTGKGIPADKIKELLNEQDWEGLKGKEGFDKRLYIARRNIELMSGQLSLESPSTISTSPDQPGCKYTFSIEVFPRVSLKENLVFRDITQLEEIECLVLARQKEPENERFKSLVDLGIKLKYLIYRQENTESLFELVKEKASTLHLLFILHSDTQNGFRIAEDLHRQNSNENLIFILVSDDPNPENYTLYRNTRIDYYIEELFVSNRIFEILLSHFPCLTQEALDKIPKAGEIDQNLSVLLVEDNLFNRKVMQGLFKVFGVEIDLAENGQIAVNMVTKKKYDIIFMDLLMPEMDGIIACKEIRKQGMEMPIIALTAVENSNSRKEAKEAGMNDYLLKPASEESLRKFLSKSYTHNV